MLPRAACLIERADPLCMAGGDLPLSSAAASSSQARAAAAFRGDNRRPLERDRFPLPGRALVAVVRGDDAAGHEGTGVASRRAWRTTVALEIPSSRAIAAFDRVPKSLRSLVMRLAGQNGRRPERRRLRA